MYHGLTHVSASPWDDVGHFILSVDSTTEFYPRGSNQHCLSANRVDVLIFDPSYETSPDPSAHYECIGLEGCESAFENLGNVLE